MFSGRTLWGINDTDCWSGKEQLKADIENIIYTPISPAINIIDHWSLLMVIPANKKQKIESVILSPPVSPGPAVNWRSLIPPKAIPDHTKQHILIWFIWLGMKSGANK